MLPVQYTKFMDWESLEHPICLRVCVLIFCKTSGYLRVVEDVAKQSMQEAVDEVHALLEYSTKGDVSAILNLLYSG